MIIDDLCDLKTALPNKFEELPSPTEAMAPYWNIAREFPHEWKMLVREFRDLAEESEEQQSSKTYSALDGALEHACELCDKRFPSERQLANHRWSKHKTRCCIRQFVGDISKCPVCETDFLSRARLVKHILEQRVRSKTRGASCRTLYLQGPLTLVPSERLMRLESRDAGLAKSSRRLGHTSLHADRPCIKRKSTTSDDARPRKRLRAKTPPEEV